MRRAALLLALLAGCSPEVPESNPPAASDVVRGDCYDTTVPPELWPLEKVGLPPCP